MSYLIAYTILFIISLVYTIVMFEKHILGKYSPIADYLYIPACIIMSLFLVGIYLIVKEGIREVKLWLIVIEVRIFLWRLKRRHRTKE